MKRFLFSAMLTAFFAIPTFAADPDKPSEENKPTETEKVPDGTFKKEGDKDAGRTKNAVSINPEREASVMAFVEQNHPQLRGLLSQLKESQPREYERAVKELLRVKDRLDSIQGKDAKLHGMELEAWKLQSRIQLISARLRMARNKNKDKAGDGAAESVNVDGREGLEQDLEEVIKKHVDVRAEILTHERNKVEQQLKKMDERLATMKTNRSTIINNQFQQATGRKQKGKGAAKGEKARAAERGKEKVAAEEANKDAAKSDKPASDDTK